VHGLSLYTFDYTRVDYVDLPDRNPPLERSYNHIYYGNDLYKRISNTNADQSPTTALVLKTMPNLPSVSNTSSNIQLIGVPHDHMADHDPGSTEATISATNTSVETTVATTRDKTPDGGNYKILQFTFSPPTAKRGRKPKDKSSFYCHKCKIRNTGQWRRGPDGLNTLCNRCGLAYAKAKKRAKQGEDDINAIIAEYREDNNNASIAQEREDRNNLAYILNNSEED
jgi:hypothetical protein